MVKRLFGLIGRKISHSFSADYFNRKFREEGIEAEYLNFDLRNISELHEILNRYPDLVGLNVTSPYKREVIPFLHILSPTAMSLQAVNTILIDGKTLKGFNTDAPGFECTIPSLRLQICGDLKSALVLGSGGASSAVCHALAKLDISYFVVSRRSDSTLKENTPIISYSQANLLIPSCELIINATPIGMYPDIEAFPNIDYTKLSNRHICYDLIYNPPETMFLKLAGKHGAQTINGLRMLLNQAELSWNIWNER